MHTYEVLVVTPGHGVCTAPWDPLSEASWNGIFRGEAPLLTEHVQAGIARVAEDGGIWCASGGDTRSSPLSEASGMREIAAQHQPYFFRHTQVASRTLLDEHARDSLGNVVLPLGLFRNLFGYYPSKLVVCGWGFKAERYRRHVEAIRWQGDFEYVSVNNPLPDMIASACAGEREKLDTTRDDGLLQAARWRKQRAQRNQRRRKLPQFEDPEFANFVGYIFSDGPTAPVPSWQGEG
jgi:hypothetical protein